MEGQDKHLVVYFASVSDKQIEAAFDGGLPGIRRRDAKSYRVQTRNAVLG